MPNHVTNEIELINASKSDLDEFRKAFLNEDGKIDFNVILPMPDCLNDFSPHSGILDVARHQLKLGYDHNPILAMLEASNRQRSVERESAMTDDELGLVEKAVSNYRECGYLYWYDWTVQHWGTKWNAYAQPDNGFGKNEKIYQFETAWSHPEGMIEKGSRNCPNVTLSVKFADEDWGSNCGSYLIKNGAQSNVDIAPRWDSMTDSEQKQRIKFAFELCNPDSDPRSYGYDEGWNYSDEVYEEYESSKAVEQ